MSNSISSSTAPAPPSFYGLDRDELSARMRERGLPAYRAKQLFSWVYRKHLRSSEGMTNLPGGLRGSLGAICDLALPHAASVHSTPDGSTHKFVLELQDGRRVECVSMRTPRRLTFCLSSQVGCALKCAFCATGLMGLQRNLEANEIVAQVLTMGDFHRWEDERFNLVFMGMGEPLANYRSVMHAVRILHEPEGLNLGIRRITVSTSGLVPQIRRLAEEGLPLGLAVSLHATTDELRDQLVPVNRRWPIRELLEAAREYGERTGRRDTLRDKHLARCNDHPEDADRLNRVARD